MVKRWDFSEYAAVGPTDDGEWVEYEDYEKLANLCEKITVLLKCVPPHKTPFGKEISAAIAEWEAME